jgi:hypothetical protein
MTSSVAATTVAEPCLRSECARENANPAGRSPRTTCDVRVSTGALLHRATSRSGAQAAGTFGSASMEQRWPPCSSLLVVQLATLARRAAAPAEATRDRSHEGEPGDSGAARRPRVLTDERG